MAVFQPKKRIILCCDGTWMDSDGDLQTPSNVTRLARAIRPVGYDYSTSPPTLIPQIVFYQNGVGTGSKSLYTKYVGGATGEGMSYHIREAYSFLCHNYHDGDEIFLIGFSRGAFTARSVSSLVRAVGVLTSAGLKYLTPIFEDWKYVGKKSWKSKHNVPWIDRPKLYSPEYQRKLLELELTRPNIQIRCVAVWDTVGALGIPLIGLLPQAPSKDYSFVDTRIEPNIEYAYQALALDEHRRSYHPTIWEKPEGQALPRILKQTWFPGVHSDIGGSYDDADLANLTLAWMVTQLDSILTIDHDLITREIRLAKESHEFHHEPNREWGLGKIHNSMSLFFRIYGSLVRTPKEYYEIDRFTRKKTGRRLENTSETIHSSVRIRMGRAGLGYNDKGRYDSSALQGWTMCGVETNPDTPIARDLPGPVGKMTDVVWKKSIHTRDTKGHWETEILEMPEDTLEGFEHQLMSLWPELARDFDGLRPGHHPTKITHAKTYPVAKVDEKHAIVPELLRRSLSHGRGRGRRRDNANRDSFVSSNASSSIRSISPGSTAGRYGYGRDSIDAVFGTGGDGAKEHDTGLTKNLEVVQEKEMGLRDQRSEPDGGVDIPRPMIRVGTF